jgi:hypothetical protein
MPGTIPARGREPSPAARRARRSPQRLKVGRRVYRIELSERRLRLALQEAGYLEEGDQVGPAVVRQVIEDCVARWLGPPK